MWSLKMVPIRDRGWLIMNKKGKDSVKTCQEKKDATEVKFKVYTIPGNPIALARARFNRDHVYNPQRHLKVATGIYLASQHDDEPLFTGPIELTVVFYLPSSRKNHPGTHHHYRPDLSNLIKFIEDAATGIIYHDDCLISSIHALKLYDTEPRTELTVKEIDDRKN